MERAPTRCALGAPGNRIILAKTKSIYTCNECGGTAPKWQGQCPSCGAWNTLVETVAEAASNTGDRMTFAPALTTFDGRKCCIRLIPWKGSHDLFAMRRANSLAVLPAGTRIEPGGTMSFLRL